MTTVTPVWLNCKKWVLIEPNPFRPVENVWKAVFDQSKSISWKYVSGLESKFSEVSEHFQTVAWPFPAWCFPDVEDFSFDSSQ